MDDALLGPDPPELAVPRNVAPEGAHVLRERLEGSPDNQRGEGLDGGDAQLVAAPDGEGEAVPLEVGVRLQDRVGRRVVRGLVHGVRAVEVLGGREPYVAGHYPGYGGHVTASFALFPASTQSQVSASAPVRGSAYSM